MQAYSKSVCGGCWLALSLAGQPYEPVLGSYGVMRLESREKGRRNSERNARQTRVRQSTLLTAGPLDQPREAVRREALLASL